MTAAFAWAPAFIVLISETLFIAGVKSAIDFWFFMSLDIFDVFEFSCCIFFAGFCGSVFAR
jgi:hypothetical protein